MKTFRKSSLITSVALLLVAIVALGGATFAWFSANNSVTASNVQISSTAVSGIYIAGTEDTPLAADWKSTLKWEDGNQPMNPVSCAFQNLASPSFYSTTTDKEDGTWNAEADELAPVNTATSFVVKDIWLKADKSGALQVTFDTSKSAELVDYARIAFVDITDENNKTLKVFSNNAVTTNAIKSQTILTDDETGAKSLDTAVVTTTAFGDTNLVENWNGQARHFKVYIYFEGQDAACVNANSYADVNVAFTFSVADATAQG